MNRASLNSWRESEWKKYSTRNPLKKRAIRNFLDMILELIPEHVETILDAGCGEGVVCNHINRSRKVSRFVGADLSLEALKAARNWNPSIHFIHASIYSFPLKNKSVDSSICLEVIEHLEKPEKALDELRRMTRNSLIISVPNSILFRLANIASLKNLPRLGEDSDHIQRYTKGSFQSLLRRKFPKSEVYVKTSFPWLIASIQNLT